MSDILLSEVEFIIAEALNGKQCPKHLDVDQSISELGIDSLTVLSLIIEATKKFNLDLNLLSESLDTPHTVSDLHNLLNMLQPKESI